MSILKDPISRRLALTLGGTIAGGLTASSAEASAEQLGASSDGGPSNANAPVNNGPAAPDTTGHGGELHRNAGGEYSSLTTNQGLPIADDENSLKAGPRGPVVLEDFILREKINHFDHERIPERVVHARGSAAHGYFELTSSLADVSKAGIFNRVGERTPVFARFSTVAGSKGSFDTARDVRGFAVKFYTQEGNWDLVGNNIPVFFIQDAIKFPDLIHAAKPEPDREFPQAQTAHDTFWDFVSLTPESTHMLMWIMSDRAIPRSLRMMEGFGIHTFRLVNEAGKSTYVKFHWRPKLGMQSLIWDEALKINGADPDYHRRDLWNAIDSGDFPEWELAVQLFNEDFAKKFDFDVLDASKIIPEELVPLRVIGPHGARPQPRQLLCRNRTGRLLSDARGAGHRLHQRSAAARPAVLLSRHADDAAGRSQFRRDPDQPAQVSGHELPARRTHAGRRTAGPRELFAQFAGEARSARRSQARLRELRRASGGR